MIMAVVVGQSGLAADEKPLIANPIIEKAIRSKYSLNKPTGELTEADLAKVTRLSLGGIQITDAGLKELAKLQQLTFINLDGTKAGVAELMKALPKCDIFWP